MVQLKRWFQFICRYSKLNKRQGIEHGLKKKTKGELDLHAPKCIRKKSGTRGADPNRPMETCPRLNEIQDENDASFQQNQCGFFLSV